MALVVVGAVAYGAWSYFGAHAKPSTEVESADVLPVATQPSPAPVVDNTTAEGLSPRPDDEADQEACSVIRRVPVDSSMIRSIGYCRARRTLEVEFVRGTVYRYWGVSEGTYEAFMAASSKGRFFDAAIRSQRYGYARVK